MTEEPASWVIKERLTGRVLFETFNAGFALTCRRDLFEVVPILDHLQSLNERKPNDDPIP